MVRFVFSVGVEVLEVDDKFCCEIGERVKV